MPSTQNGASLGARTYTLWFFLTVAAAGFALTAAGLTGAPEAFVPWGLATMAFAALVFLFLQFWYSQMAPTATAPRAVRGKAKPPVRENLDDLAQRAVNEASSRPEEGLVEFTLEAAPKDEPDLPAPAAPRREGAWPETTEAQWRRQRQKNLPPGEFELPPAFRKRKEFTADMPIVRSIFEDGPEEDDGPTEVEGKTRGQCGECKTYLWAPKRRPIRLRCPKCGKVARLTA